MARSYKGYAHNTSVSVDKSKREIETMLTRFGAQGYQTGWQQAMGDDPGWDVIGFMWKNRQIRFRLDRPNPKKFSASMIDQLNRSRWRVLGLVIKAKLEAVHAGVSIFEEEFLANIVTANDQTFGQILVPRIVAMTEGKRLAVHAGPDGTAVSATVIE